jgi:excinuclease ABC subunit C
MRSEDLVAGDDYAMMREMLLRRFGRLVKEAPRVACGPSKGRHAEEPGEAGRLQAPTDGAAPPAAPEASVRASRRASGAPQHNEVGGETAPADPDAFPAWPDLVLIDGGKGQLEAARAALAELGVTDVPLVGVAKGRDRDAGRETFFMPGKAPIRLPPRDPALYFVQRLRDEAHRFAIGAHRAKRKRELTASPLDEIPGIGPSRKRALLHHFGTAKAIGRAGLDDLMRTPGVNAATARTVYEHFRGG